MAGGGPGPEPPPPPGNLAELGKALRGGGVALYVQAANCEGPSAGGGVENGRRRGANGILWGTKGSGVWTSIESPRLLASAELRSVTSLLSPVPLLWLLAMVYILLKTRFMFKRKIAGQMRNDGEKFPTFCVNVFCTSTVEHHTQGRNWCTYSAKLTPLRSWITNPSEHPMKIET